MEPLVSLSIGVGLAVVAGGLLVVDSRQRKLLSRGDTSLSPAAEPDSPVTATATAGDDDLPAFLRPTAPAEDVQETCQADVEPGIAPVLDVDHVGAEYESVDDAVDVVVEEELAGLKEINSADQEEPGDVHTPAPAPMLPQQQVKKSGGLADFWAIVTGRAKRSRRSWATAHGFSFVTRDPLLTDEWITGPAAGGVHAFNVASGSIFGHEMHVVDAAGTTLIAVATGGRTAVTISLFTDEGASDPRLVNVSAVEGFMIAGDEPSLIQGFAADQRLGGALAKLPGTVTAVWITGGWLIADIGRTSPPSDWDRALKPLATVADVARLLPPAAVTEEQVHYADPLVFDPSRPSLAAPLRESDDSMSTAFIRDVVPAPGAKAYTTRQDEKGDAAGQKNPLTRNVGAPEPLKVVESSVYPFPILPNEKLPSRTMFTLKGEPCDRLIGDDRIDPIGEDFNKADQRGWPSARRRQTNPTIFGDGDQPAAGGGDGDESF